MTAELNSLDFSEKIVEISIAVILHQAGFHSSEKSALNILTAVVPLYINLLVKNPHLLINDSIASFFHNWASLDSAPFPRLVPPKYPVPFHLVTKDPNPPKIIPVKTPDSPKIVKKHSIFSTLPQDLNIDTISDVSINENDPVLETISSLKPNDSKLFKSYYSKLLDPYSLKDADPLNNSTLIVKNLLINTLPYLPNLTRYISLTKSHDAPPLSAPASPSTAPSVAKKRKTAPSKLKNEQDSRASSVDPVKREKSTEPVNLSMKAPFGLASSPVNVPLIKLGESSTPASSPPAKIKLKLKF